MKIEIISDLQNQECDILVVNLFEGEKTTQEIANKYLVKHIFYQPMESKKQEKFWLSGSVKKKNFALAN